MKYEIHEDEPQVVNEDISIAYQSGGVVDAIWDSIVCQSISIQESLSKRLNAHLANERRLVQERYVRDTITRAMKELRQAEAEGRELPDARLLFEQIDD